jgi:hypothetical protein
VDVCLNGDEIKTNLRYGRSVTKNVVATGSKALRFYEHDPRPCRGHRVGESSFTLDPAQDLTIVVTKHAPKILTFDNSGLGEIPALGPPIVGMAAYAFRSAAEIAANLTFRAWSPNDGDINPSGVFTKGQEGAGIGLKPGLRFEARATIAGGSDPIRAPMVTIIASHRHEWILVGTRRANARWAVLDRLVSQPSP